MIKSLHYSFGERRPPADPLEAEMPHITFPLYRVMDGFVVTPAGEFLPILLSFVDFFFFTIRRYCLFLLQRLNLVANVVPMKHQNCTWLRSMLGAFVSYDNNELHTLQDLGRGVGC